MADKTRIQDLAKELGVESKTVLAKLQELGEYVKSASSHVEAPVARRLRAAFEGEDALQANAESHVGGRLESASAPSFGDHAIKSPRANPIVQTVGGNDEDSKQQQIAGALPASQQVSSPSDVSSSDVDKHIIDTNESVIASPTLSVMIYLSARSSSGLQPSTATRRSRSVTCCYIVRRPARYCEDRGACGGNATRPASGRNSHVGHDAARSSTDCFPAADQRCGCSNPGSPHPEDRLVGGRSPAHSSAAIQARPLPESCAYTTRCPTCVEL